MLLLLPVFVIVLAKAPFLLKMMNFLKENCGMLYLFVVKPTSESEDTSLRVERKDIISPVRQYRVRHLSISVFIRIHGMKGTNSIAQRSIFRDIKWVRRQGEFRAVVVRVTHLLKIIKTFKLT